MNFNVSRALRSRPLSLVIAVALSINFILFSSAFSGQTDRIKVFFNDPPDTKNIDIELANFIDGAKKSVSAHFYQLNRQCVVDAFIRAAKRLGAKNVKLITDNKYYKNKKFEPFYASLEGAGIAIITDEAEGANVKGGHGESHNKFVVADEARVWTGSYNPTDNNTVKDYNNALIIDSADVAKLYAAEFTQMYDQRLFSKKKSQISGSHSFRIDSTEIEIYFSPADDANSKICNLMKQAKKSISFVLFAFTEDDIEGTLYAKHNEGLLVQGICDDLSAGGKSSGYYTLLGYKMNIKKDANPRAQLHDKFTVIDHESDTAAVVVTGSHNYTKSANEKNDENIVVIRDKYYALLYYNEFAKIYGAPLIKIDNASNVKQALPPAASSEVKLVPSKKTDAVPSNAPAAQNNNNNSPSLPATGTVPVNIK